MSGHEIVHVAIAPPPALEAELINQVAAIMSKALYDVRLLLAGRIPKVIAHYDNVQTAQSIVQSLRDLGLVAILCTDSELRKPSQSFRPHTLAFGDGEVLFRREGGQERSVGSADAFLIMKGKRETHTRTEATTTTTKFSLPATMLTGGIPVWRNVKVKTTEASSEAECFARIYGRKSSEPTVEVLQHSVDYSFLGAEMAPSSLKNFSTVVEKLRRLFPGAVFDDRLTTHPGTGAPSSGIQNDAESNCRLIYLCHLARSGVTDEGQAGGKAGASFSD